jgi:sulfur relay protein TusB/DsrH
MAFSDEPDELLFLGDGVMHLVSDCWETGDVNFENCIFLAEDLEARGLAGIARESGARVVSDQEFVCLLRKHQACLTWK